LEARVLFSSEVEKKNAFGLEQTRHFVVTSQAIYNFKPGVYTQAQRIIPAAHITGLVCSTASMRVVVQVRSAHDYYVIFPWAVFERGPVFQDLLSTLFTSLFPTKTLPAHRVVGN
jgi:fructose-specific phosphotransferase system IIC component